MHRAWLLSGLVHWALAFDLPYNPTRIHLISQSGLRPSAFILQPGSDSTTSAHLTAIDLSSPLDSTSVNPKVLSTALPFLSSAKPTAYTSFVDATGNLTVISGDCTAGVTGTTLWRLAPDTSAREGGAWTRGSVARSKLQGQGSVGGSNYLSAGIAFSEMIASNVSDTDLYLFGGMCPTDSVSTMSWTNSANYSNSMLALSPQGTTTSSSSYDIELVTSRGPPIAEAGMTITPLSPTYSNTSGVDTQQQNFVVLGGHTQTAFINMSQVALFSLPQAIWSFQTVQQPASTAVTPRSGHTAVLSEDGRTIIVYGGWVGDVNTPATPQLAILQLGSGYGGQGSWQWTVPASAGTFSGGPGLYGHGAVMLPGNVMLISGGYAISTTLSGSRLERRDSPIQSTKTLLYNITSNSWVTTYTAPAASSSTPEGTSTGSLASPSAKAGVGVGVTFGVAALVGAGLLYVWHSKRSKRQRLNRSSIYGNPHMSDKPTWDDGWDRPSLIGGHYEKVADSPETPRREAFPWLPDLPNSGASIPATSRAVDTSGAFVNIPSPTRGLRRSGVRSQYSTDSAEPRPISGIHPIVEADEETQSNHSRSNIADVHRRMMAVQEIHESRQRGLSLSGGLPENPFADPDPNPLRSHPVSPVLDRGDLRGNPPINAAFAVRGHNRDKSDSSMQDWLSSHSSSSMKGRLSPSKASSDGRASPTKSGYDDRTMSTLSDRSNHSYRSARSVARSTSNRSHNLPGSHPRASPLPTPTEEHTFSFTSTTTSSAPIRQRSVTSPSRAAHHRPTLSVSTDANTLIGTTSDLQVLMSKRAGRPASSIYSSTAYHADDTDPTPTSPTRKPLGWVGSIRKAIGSYAGLERSASGTILAPPLSAATAHATDRSLTPSPTRGAGPKRHRPRRTASDGSTFLALKRGREDWDGEGARGNAWEGYRDDVDGGGDWGEPGPDSPVLDQGGSMGQVGKRRGLGVRGRDEEEWDVEGAAELRDVQVMFTVPKARLRVVNVDPDRVSLRSVSGGSGPGGKSPNVNGGKGSPRVGSGERETLGGAARRS